MHLFVTINRKNMVFIGILYGIKWLIIFTRKNLI